MLQLLSREHELCAPSDRERSGPFSSMHGESARAVSLHAAIMAATGGAVSVNHALECPLGSRQHAERCDAGVQVPETSETDEQFQLVSSMQYSLWQQISPCCASLSRLVENRCVPCTVWTC
jgi:hypothetical protein